MPAGGLVDFEDDSGVAVRHLAHIEGKLGERRACRTYSPEKTRKRFAYLR